MGRMPVERVLEVVSDGADVVIADVTWCQCGGLDLLTYVETERADGLADAEIEASIPSRWDWLHDAEIVGDTVFAYASRVPAVL